MSDLSDKSDLSDLSDKSVKSDKSQRSGTMNAEDCSLKIIPQFLPQFLLNIDGNIEKIL